MMKSLKLVCIHVLLFSTSNSSSCVASSTSTTTSTSSSQFLSKSTSKLDTNLFSHRTNTNTIATRGGASTNQSTTTTNKTLSSSEMAFAGAVATALGVVLMHPIDTIKTLQQSSEGIGLNMIGATNKILSRGGVPALYEGLGPYVTSDGLAGALKFATYETLKKMDASTHPRRTTRKCHIRMCSISIHGIIHRISSWRIIETTIANGSNIIG